MNHEIRFFLSLQYLLLLHMTREMGVVNLDISKEVVSGQSVYSKPVLSIYDFWVLGISNQFIWKCPSSKLLAHFNNHITSNHLDIGVGTGYFLDKCQFTSSDVRIVLMDLNNNSLTEACKRLKRYSPTQYRINILDEVKLEIPTFDSISMNYLFHCLPGKMPDKLTVFDNIRNLLSDSGTVFGATILNDGVERSLIAKKLMSLYNNKGIFSNREDSLDKLESVLSSKFDQYKIDIIGCVALFSAS